MSDSNTKTNQIGNVVTGDNAGRDLHKVEHHHHHATSSLRQIAERYREAHRDDVVFEGFIERLQHFMADVTSGEFLGLDAKLRAGRRASYIPSAIQLKEEFTKKLYKHQFSEHAQDVFAHILAHIHVSFLNKVRPKIAAGFAIHEVDEIVHGLVADVYDQVGSSPLNITMTEVQGMLYFLTGNCHIEWT